MKTTILLKELSFKAVRSGGAGGQHVNKVSSKVELSFDIENSEGLSMEEKELLKLKLSSKLSNEHVLILSCDESRSQHKNKELVIERFFELLKKSLIIPKKRRPTKPTKSSIEKRIEKKKDIGLKKSLRKKPEL